MPRESDCNLFLFANSPFRSKWNWKNVVMVDSRDFYGRSFVTPSVQNPVINPISPPSGHMQWNHPVHHPQPFNTDYQIPRYPAYSNIRKVSNQGLVDGSFVRIYWNCKSYSSEFSTGNLERLIYAAIDQTDLGLKSIITNLPDSDKSSFRLANI